MRTSDKLDLILYGSTLLVVILAVVLFAWQEARSYQKFCDTPVTTWDAIFLDLRIDECKCDE